MSIQTRIFPLTMSQLTGKPEFKTDITTGQSGQESRNALWQDAKWNYNAAYTIRSRDDAYTLYKFFLGCYGKETPFLIQDVFDYKISQDGTTFQKIGTGDGSTLTFQIVKTYTEQGITYSRTILRPSTTAGDLVVKVDGVTKTNPTHYGYSTTTGVITFTGGNAPANGKDVTITLQKFWVPVRFEMDEFPIDSVLYWLNNGADYSQHSLPQIPMVGVRDTA